MISKKNVDDVKYCPIGNVTTGWTQPTPSFLDILFIRTNNYDWLMSKNQNIINTQRLEALFGLKSLEAEIVQNKSFVRHLMFNDWNF